MSQRKITANEAAIIERENNLKPGVIAFDRPATEAEEIYLDQVDACPLLAFHADGSPGRIALYVVRRDHRLSEEDFIEKTKNLLIICRARTRFKHGQEALSLGLVNWGSKANGASAMSIDINSASMGWIFTNMSRRYLLLPTFKVIPPTEFEERSPGRCMHGLLVAQVIHVDLVLLKGASSLRNFGIDHIDKLLIQ